MKKSKESKKGKVKNEFISILWPGDLARMTYKDSEDFRACVLVLKKEMIDVKKERKHLIKGAIEHPVRYVVLIGIKKKKIWGGWLEKI